MYKIDELVHSCQINLMWLDNDFPAGATGCANQQNYHSNLFLRQKRIAGNGCDNSVAPHSKIPLGMNKIYEVVQPTALISSSTISHSLHKYREEIRYLYEPEIDRFIHESRLMSKNSNWIESAIEGKDAKLDMVVIENPSVKDLYDKMLSTIWIPIREHLQQSGYTYTPEFEPQLESEGRTILSRKLTWMLHETSRAMYRGSVELNKMHWMIENEFFMCLNPQIDFRFISEIIGNSRLSGNPPELSIHKRHAQDPEGYYQIRFLSGFGENFYEGCEEKIVERVKKCIDVNVEMNEITLDGAWDETSVGEFLSAAYHVYEAY